MSETAPLSLLPRPPAKITAVIGEMSCMDLKGCKLIWF